MAREKIAGGGKKHFVKRRRLTLITLSNPRPGGDRGGQPEDL